MYALSSQLFMFIYVPYFLVFTIFWAFFFTKTRIENSFILFSSSRDLRVRRKLFSYFNKIGTGVTLWRNYDKKAPETTQMLFYYFYDTISTKFLFPVFFIGPFDALCKLYDLSSLMFWLRWRILIIVLIYPFVIYLVELLSLPNPTILQMFYSFYICSST